MTSQDSWLRRLGREHKETSGLVDKCSTGGVIKYIPGNGLPKNITKFGNELPGLQNLLMTKEIHAASPHIRRMPSFRKFRNHDAEYTSMGDEVRPSTGIIHLMPPFENYRHHDAEFICKGGVYFRRTPIYDVLIWTPQLSFSRLPVSNPYYFQHIESEYY
jgi:hypothetical protein